jgi:hypothetical protein
MALHRAHKSAGAAQTLEACARTVGIARVLGSPVLARFDR